MNAKPKGSIIWSGLVIASITFGFALTFQNIFKGTHFSWWLVVILILAPIIIWQILMMTLHRVKPPSIDTIMHSFDKVDVQKLRSMVLTIPKGWKYKKLERGLHTFFVEECLFQAAISIELTYINETEINTLEKCMMYANEFVKRRNSNLIFNRITERWGMPIHEFADQSPKTAGHHVTAYYHGTEYGFQLRLNEVYLATAARQLFEKFLEHIQFESPDLCQHVAFSGRLRIRLPKGFVALDIVEPDRQVWRAIDRQNCTVTIIRCPNQHGTLSANLLYPLLNECPHPKKAANEITHSRFLHLSENGFGGIIYYQASDTWGWFVSAGDLPTGGRYIFCLDDKDPKQEPYYGVYHYQQIAFEILVSLAEMEVLVP